MPELPEAETIVRGLAERLPGRCVLRVQVKHANVLAPLSAARFRASMRGRCFAAVQRRGKKIVLMLADGGRLVVSLGMTGRLVLSAAPRSRELSHVAVRFDLDDGQALLYDDVRRFGRLHVHDDESWTGQDAVLGAEPLGEHLSARGFHDLTQRSRTPIRNWLLDQRRIVGVGNIYANEALFRARIAPTRPANSLSRAEAGRLMTELREVLQEAITARGTTISDFRDEQGESGGFAPRLRVYGRAGEPCLKCGSTIERVVLSNRSAFFCPQCQK